MFKDYLCPACRENLQDIIDSMCEGYAVHEIICDENGTPVNYRFLEVNCAFEQMTGLKREDIINKTVKEVLPEIDAFWIETYGKVAATGEPVNFENYAAVLGRYFRVSVFTPKLGNFITLFTDITEMKKSEEALKKHKLLFECAQDAVLYVRSDGKIIDANMAASKLYGYTNEELLSLSIHQIRHFSTRFKFEQQMKQADASGLVFESLHVRKDGSGVPVEVSSRGTLIGNERVRIHIIRDITERKITEEQIIYLANHDSLTGLPNRAFLMSELEKAIGQAERGRYKFAVMLFDIDKFKSINDKYGHHAGDAVLKTVSGRVRDLIRNIDTVGRLGGDEFLLIQPMIKAQEDAQKLVNRMFEALSEPLNIGDAALDVGISVGISIYPDDAKDINGLMRYSDEAMYRAKKDVGNSLRFYAEKPQVAPL